MADADGTQTPRIVTRRIAKLAGKTRYFNGKPCPAGHFDERMVSSGRCVVCTRIARDEWNAANPERVASNRAAYYLKNRDAEIAQVRAYQMANRSRVAARSAAYRSHNKGKRRAWFIAWTTANPEKVRGYVTKRRALKLKVGGTHTAEDINRLFDLQRGRCAHSWCRKPLGARYHHDHIMPLARGGLNDRRNIQLLCQPCNNKKWAHHPIDVARANGMLL